MLLGIAMVMVLFENERNAVQENTLALSTLGVDPRRLLSADDLLPSMQSALERLARRFVRRGGPSSTSRERWRGLLPSVERGFLAEFLEVLTKTGAGEYICELAYRQGGLFTVHDLADMTEPLPMAPRGTFADFKKVIRGSRHSQPDRRESADPRTRFRGDFISSCGTQGVWRVGSATDGGTGFATRTYARKLPDRARRPPPHTRNTNC